MKSIFLVALFFLVTNWPTPSASWSLNQQYASMDPAQMNNFYAQHQAYDNQFGNGKLMNGAFRLNPDLFVSNDDRRAFSRTVGSSGGGGARARKLSSTRFNLKPFEKIDNDEEEFEAELVPSQHEQIELPQQQQQQIKQQEQQQQHQKDEAQTSISKLAQEATKKLSEQKQDASIKQDAKQDIKSTSSAAAAAQSEKKDIKENTADDAKTIKIDQKAAAADQDQSPKGEFIKPLNYKSRQQQFNSRPIVSQFQQQQPIFQQQQQQQPTENVEQLRFQVGQADMVNTVDMNVVKNEAVRTMNYRNENQGQEVPLSGKYQQPTSYYKDGGRQQNEYRGSQGSQGSQGGHSGFGGHGAGAHLAHEIEKDAKRVMKGFDTIKGSFSSLIIIANSNANSNLGVSSIDIDLLKSFLSTYFLGKSVEYVLKDADLNKLIEKFNEEHLKSYSTNGGSGNKYDKYEATSQLSANIPVLSNEHEKAAPKKETQGSSSHSENTVVVKKEPQDAADTVNLHHKNYYQQQPKHHGYYPGGGYYYMPYKKGGVIVINNLNDNVNDRVRAVLSGKDYNMSEYNSGLILPLAKEEIDELMNDAIIVNNDNKNKNKY